MKALKIFALLMAVAAGAGMAWGLIEATHPPAWALILTLTVCAVVLWAAHGIKRELAWIRCELHGHWVATFKKYDDTGYCPRCKEPIASRSPEADGPGMQSCENTLHQRLSWVETALLRIENALGIEETAE